VCGAAEPRWLLRLSGSTNATVRAMYMDPGQPLTADEARHVESTFIGLARNAPPNEHLDTPTFMRALGWRLNRYRTYGATLKALSSGCTSDSALNSGAQSGTSFSRAGI